MDGWMDGHEWMSVGCLICDTGHGGFFTMYLLAGYGWLAAGEITAVSPASNRCF